MNNLMNEDIACWWFDESVKVFLFWYYWPAFVIGNYDDWMSLGLTLNGIKGKPVDFFNPQGYNICKV